jgi:hypothetical protein
MSKLLNALLDDAVEIVGEMIANGGPVRPCILTVCGPACADPALRAGRKPIVTEMSGPRSSAAMAERVRSVLARHDALAYGTVAPAWVPYPRSADGIARHRDGVHVSAVDRVGHRLSRTYRIDLDAAGRPHLNMIPELSGLTLLSDLSTTTFDEAPARVH